MDNIRSKAFNLLRSSEKYTKTDMVYLTKGSFWLFLSQGINMLVLFGLSVVYANFLDPNTYGIYKYVISLAGVLGAFSLTGITTFIIQRINTGFNIDLWKMFVLGLKWHLPSFLLSLLGSAYYFINNNIVLSASLLLIAILWPIYSSSTIYTSYLEGLKKFKIKAIIVSIYTIITSLSFATTVLLTKNIFIIIFTYFLINTVLSFVLLILIKNKITLEDNRKPIGSFSFAKHLSLIKIIGIIGARIDSILVFTFIGAPELAAYTFATAIPNQMLGAISNLRTLALPKFSSNSTLTGKVVNKKISRLFAISIPLYILYFFLAPYIFSVFFPQYSGVVIYSQIFALLIIFSGAGLQNAFLDSKEEVKKKYILNVTIDSAKIIFLVALIIPFGLWGAIIARVLGKMFSYYFSFYILSKVK